MREWKKWIPAISSLGLVFFLACTAQAQTSATFSSTGNLNAARQSHTSTLLNNGLVLTAGGYNGSYVSSAELYDPASGTFLGYDGRRHHC